MEELASALPMSGAPYIYLYVLLCCYPFSRESSTPL